MCNTFCLENMTKFDRPEYCKKQNKTFFKLVAEEDQQRHDQLHALEVNPTDHRDGG